MQGKPKSREIEMGAYDDLISMMNQMMKKRKNKMLGMEEGSPEEEAGESKDEEDTEEQIGQEKGNAPDGEAQPADGPAAEGEEEDYRKAYFRPKVPKVSMEGKMVRVGMAPKKAMPGKRKH